jgi:hypothetical protein
MATSLQTPVPSTGNCIGVGAATVFTIGPAVHTQRIKTHRARLRQRSVIGECHGCQTCCSKLRQQQRRRDAQYKCTRTYEQDMPSRGRCKLGNGTYPRRCGGCQLAPFSQTFHGLRGSGASARVHRRHSPAHVTVCAFYILVYARQKRHGRHTAAPRERPAFVTCTQIGGSFGDLPLAVASLLFLHDVVHRCDDCPLPDGTARTTLTWPPQATCTSKLIQSASNLASGRTLGIGVAHCFGIWFCVLYFFFFKKPHFSVRASSGLVLESRGDFLAVSVSTQTPRRTSSYQPHRHAQQ